jgi:RNA polymerase sigma-70 factor (ECF subfamily)
MLHARFSEELLLRDLHNGSVEAFEQIFKIYWDDLYRIAKVKLQSSDEAEDVIQNIFSNLWEKRESLEINDLSAYLYGALKNRIINIIRTRITRDKYWNYYKTFVPDSHRIIENSVGMDDLNNAVTEAVNLLPEKSREVFKLSRIEGRSNAEIANLLNLSEKAIEYHLTKCLRALRLRLKDYILLIVACFNI